MGKRIRLKLNKHSANQQWNLYTQMEEILTVATKPDFLNRMQANVLEHEIAPLIRATRAIEQSSSFTQGILTNYDSLCTSMGFCGLSVSLVEIPNMQELTDTAVVGLIYVDNTNVYLCLDSSVKLQVRNFARISLLAYLQLNFGSVICSSGVAPCFMLYKNEATRMLVTKNIDEDECKQLVWLTNYILLKHLTVLPKGKWLHSYMEKDIILCCDNCSENESHLARLLCTAEECELFVNKAGLNLLDVSSIQTYYNSLIHIIDSDNLSMSKVEFGYPIDKSQNLSNMLGTTTMPIRNVNSNGNFYEVLLGINNCYGAYANCCLALLISALVETPKSAADLEELVFSTMRVQGNLSLEEFVSMLLSAFMLEYSANGVGVITPEAYLNLLMTVDKMKQS